MRKKQQWKIIDIYILDEPVASDHLGKQKGSFRIFIYRNLRNDPFSDPGMTPFQILFRSNTMKKLNLKNESALLHFALDKGIVKKTGGLDWSD